MDSWICFLDVDGTISYHGTILDSTIKAIEDIQKKGHKVVLATGRSFAQLDEILQLIHPDGLITFNGQNVEFEGKTIYSSKIEKAVLKSIFDDINERNGWYAFLSREHFGTNDKSHPVLKTFIDDLKIKMPVELDKTYPFEKDIYSIAMMIDDMPYLINKYSMLDFVYVNRFGYDAFNKDGGKGKACRRLCEALGHPLEKTVAFGDNMNDLELLEIVKYGIAMGNANQDLKQRAKFVTKASLDDGILYGLTKFTKLL